MTRLTRRQLCGVLGTATVSVSMGCVTPTDFPRQRTLGIDRIDVEEVDTGWRLTVTVFTGVDDFDGTKADFHDVVLLGYANDGSVACERRIGDITDEDRRNLVTTELECPVLPEILTFRAEESPCDEDTVISIYEYQGTVENIGHHWSSTGARQCDEGLPPDHDT